MSGTLTGRQSACHLTDVVSGGGRLLLNVGQPPRVKSRSFTRRLCGRSAAAQVGDVIQASQPASRILAIATNEPWVRWLDTPDHVVALVDQAGDTTLDVDQDAVAAGDAEIRAARGGASPGWQRAGDRGRADDGTAAVLLPKQSKYQAASYLEPTIID
jgi:alpha-L-fucosidase